MADRRTRSLLIVATLVGLLGGLWASTWTIGTRAVRKSASMGSASTFSPFPGVVWISDRGDYEIHLWAPGWSRRVYASNPFRGYSINVF